MSTMASSETFIIVGAGMTGANTAQALREQGFDGRILLIGEEPHLPYERPPLSKGYLMGQAERASAFVHEESWYSENEIELQLEQHATRLTPSTHHLELSGGTQLEYDKLLLATGATPRKLALPGSDAAGVRCLRSIDDSERLKESLTPGSRLVVIGAGWIGLEVAAAARTAGTEVTVVETDALPLLRVLGPEVARTFAQLHEERGVDFRFETTVESIRSENGAVTGVLLSDGSEVAADTVLVAVGVEPNTALAHDGLLDVSNGVVVDSALRTSDPDVFAAGDVANTWHPLLDRRIRVEHWANALKQPATAAASMLGNDAAYDELPYFFTDQYDLGMEYVGYVDPGYYDRVVIRGDADRREFVAFWLKDDRVLAGMNVNVWDVTDPIKTLIRSGAKVDAGRLADAGQPLDRLTGG
ncbi:NAD(P)/FAD-dependent oxidoreductase [Parasphingorhabdus pacifica]